MKEKIIKRCLIGAVVGISIGNMISIITSLIWGQGYYSPCEPTFVKQMGSEINAVIVQTLLTAILGAAYSGSSAIWEIEDISIAKQTGLFFLVTSLAMLPIAYVTHWMEHTFIGFAVYFLVFVAIFIVIWFTQYILWKNQIQQINKSIHK
ncbi:MAG: DUF3021 domain-containing protein [Coprobacillus sp.]